MVAYISGVALPAKVVQAALIWLTVCAEQIDTHGCLYERCSTTWKGGVGSAYLVDCVYRVVVGQIDTHGCLYERCITTFEGGVGNANLVNFVYSVVVARIDRYAWLPVWAAYRQIRMYVPFRV